MINYLYKNKFLKLITRYPYWKNGKARWGYIGIAVNILRKISPKTVLEVGSHGINLTSVSDTLDIEGRNKLTYLMDADNTPWPIKDKKYDAFVALQVFEHLSKQINVFNEACRVSENVIVSVPYLWKNHGLKNHNGINDCVVLKWSSGRKWNYSKVVGKKFKRKVYWWILDEKV